MQASPAKTSVQLSAEAERTIRLRVRNIFGCEREIGLPFGSPGKPRNWPERYVPSICCQQEGDCMGYYAPYYACDGHLSFTIPMADLSHNFKPCCYQRPISKLSFIRWRRRTDELWITENALGRTDSNSQKARDFHVKECYAVSRRLYKSIQ